MPVIVKDKDFSKLDLTSVKGDNWFFIRCKFDGANLANSTFETAHFNGCSFNRTSWEKSNLSEAKFQQEDGGHTDTECQYDKFQSSEENKEIGWPIIPACQDPLECTGYLSSFHRCNLSLASFSGYSLNDSDFSEADLTGASFVKTSLDHCSFHNIRFVNNNCRTDSKENNVLFGEETSLEFTDFSGTNLQGLQFRNCKSLEAANFAHADLEGAIFEGHTDSLMPLYRACFDNVRLREVVFNNCELDSASFIGGDLRNIKFKGKTTGRAAVFSNSNLAGCQAETINFTAANFSNAFIGNDTENKEAEAASFREAILVSAIFSNAALIGVNFDKAVLTLADFDSATFAFKTNNEDDDQKINSQIKGRPFKETKLEKAVFNNSTLYGCQFISCEATGASFDNSDLEKVEFIDSELGECSFAESYLVDAKFSFSKQTKDEASTPGKRVINGSSFANSKLSKVTFANSSLVGSDFSRSDLFDATFQNSTLIGSDFKSANLKKSKFNNCDLCSVNFEQVDLNECKLNSVKLSRAQFVRAHGDEIEIITDDNDDTRAVVFRLHKLSGLFNTKIHGAIVEHGIIKANDQSNLTWENGFYCVGSVFEVEGDLVIKKGGLLENTKITTTNCKHFLLELSTARSSLFEGLNCNCKFDNTTLESCNLLDNWDTPTYREVTINLTTLGKTSSNIDICNLKLKELNPNNKNDNFDRSSIGALKANAHSLGNDKEYDKFFNLEKESEIIDQRSKNSCLEKKWHTQLAFFLGVFFFLFPATPYALPGLDVNSIWGYLICISTMIAIGRLLYLSKGTFLNFLYGYGHSFSKIYRSIGVIIFGFTLSWIGNKLWKMSSVGHHFNSDINFLLFKNSFHSSVNSFVAIGFWDNAVKGPEGIMVLYSNIEALLGIICMALLVVTIIRRTSGR